LSRADTSVVHFQLSQYPAVIMAFCAAARALGKRTVITAHNIVSHEEKPWERTVFAALYRMCDRIIVHAEDNRKEMSSLFSLDPGKITVIPHGNYMFFNGAQDPEPAPASPAILFFGYIRPYKGLSHLLNALAAVKARLPGVRLLIVGKPVEDFSSYREQIDRLGLAGNVVTELGYVPFEKVKDYFLKASIVALPYLKVYQSGVLQLAYAFSRPVIVTDTGGMAEAVDEGKSGFIVLPGDERALAEKLIVFLSDRSVQERMGEYAFRMAQSRFSWESISRSTLEAYGG
jgi:glycosyltransferase involved in cell wall biosynthesis